MNPAMTMSRHPATQPLSPTTMGKVPMLEIWYSLIAAVWRRRYVIALPIVLMPLLGAVIGHFMPRSFETRMSILIQEPSKLNPFLEDLSVKTNLKDRMDALRALLTSRYVMAGVAEDLGLLKGDSSEAAQDRVVADLAGAVSVQLIGNEMVELRYRAASPFGIDRVLMRIGERFMQRVAAPEDSSMRSSVTFLEAQLKAATDKLGESGLDYFIGAHCTGIETVYSFRRLLSLDRAHAVVGAVGASFELGRGIDPGNIAQ